MKSLTDELNTYLNYSLFGKEKTQSLEQLTVLRELFRALDASEQENMVLKYM